MADACDDGLLAVGTHRLYGAGLEHLPLQDCDGSGGPRRRDDGGRVAACGAKASGARPELARHALGEVARWRVEATWESGTASEAARLVVVAMLFMP